MAHEITTPLEPSNGAGDILTKILVPLTDSFDARPCLSLASALASRQGAVLALKVVGIPAGESLSAGAEMAPAYRASLDQIHAQFSDRRVELKTLVRVAHEIKEGIAETARDEACDLLVLPWKGYSNSEERFYGGTIDQLLACPPCNTLVVRGGNFSACKRILLPLRGGPYAIFALEIVRSLARSFGAEVTVLHCEHSSRKSGIGSRTHRSFLHQLQFYPHLTRLTTVRGDPKAAILKEASTHDLIVIGAGFKPQPQDYFLGSVVEHVSQKSDKPLIVVKTTASSPTEFGLAAAEEKPRSLSETVDKWFAENTFHRREFDDLIKLFDLKEKQRITVSLGFPTLNEAETVGAVISTVKKKLFDEVPLLDEIVLIDSGSTDDTVRIAEDLGIPVHVHQEILPSHGSYRGKGEALWKSLNVLEGDIIIWIDTDIKNIHPGFVYGVLGPLLRDPEIQYVKGFYRRPLATIDGNYAEGGGRVTELTARPFLNLFFPELSGIIQPLAGEYGGRRKVLESVPFFTGYGVETGLLIDIFNKFGLRSIAQVDLEERKHRNQSLSSLGQMSFAIIQVFMQRLEEKNLIKLLEDVNRSMKLIKHRGETYSLDVKAISDGERPPIISIPEYRNRQKEISSRRKEGFNERLSTYRDHGSRRNASESGR